MRKPLVILLAPAVALFAAACGSSSTTSTTSSASTPAASSTTSTPAAGAAQISTRTLPGLGSVVVNAKGHTLYVFAPDKAKKVTCVGACAAIWPPLALSSGQKPVVSGQAKSSLVGSDPNPAGGRTVTCRLAAVQLRHRHLTGERTRPSAQAQWGPVVRDRAIRQADHQEGKHKHRRILSVRSHSSIIGRPISLPRSR